MSSYPIKEYVALPEEDQVWLWKGILPTSGSTLLFAKQKVGKSFLAIKLAEAIADPKVDRYLGQEICVHGRVLYIQLDTPRGLWKKNYVSLVTSEAAREGVFIIDRNLPDIPLPFDLRKPECQIWLRSEVDRVQPVLTVLDTIRRVHYANENDPTEMTIIHDAIVKCTTPSGLLYIAHEKKIQWEGAEASVRGSTALTGAVDAIINMSKTKLTLEARSDVEEEIPIYQQKDGTFALNTKEEDIADFIAELGDKPAGQVNKAIMDTYGVSEATAKRWRGVKK